MSKLCYEVDAHECYVFLVSWPFYQHEIYFFVPCNVCDLIPFLFDISIAILFVFVFSSGIALNF